MKKILITVITIGSILFGIDVVDAKEAKCVYEINERTSFTVNIENDILTTSSSFENASITVKNELTAKDFTKPDGDLACLNRITYNKVYDGASGHITFTFSKENGNSSVSLNSSASSVNNKTSWGEGTSGTGKPDLSVSVDLDPKTGCGVISSDLRDWLNQLLGFVKIGAIVLTIILGMFDFLKATISDEADAMKKAWKKFIRRLIAVALLFLIPVIIEFILGVIDIEGVDASNPLCGLK